ncbi:MAG: 23S rRNA (uracil-C(5))-methyltransferase RlmCD [Candidatus Ordinivivax streblomastigis]|uniref:23S rRNA (Uracil-C(5))-methyltransferase RlmCD n=1 Tax=Candidatus Ordinivivax streblomastigis TaxID=2540710 RepID=A0A5M8P0L6_9BACT|nr:MAG: 23S rRNA (uracil-C(5))-methyltransferase RlmCD [Candidatus Ordinivivax streblomastigis]
MKKPLPVLENVRITGIASEGKAIAKHNDLVIFIPFVVPGDVADIQLTRKKNSYAEGRAIHFYEYSSQRIPAFCKHYGVCGGCKWQILPYSEQIRYKQQQVIDNLTRIGKVALPEISPILGSEKTQFYRNKLEYTFSNKRWMTLEEVQSGQTFENMNALGFHIPTLFDKVLDIDECGLQAEPSNSIRLEIKAFCQQHQYSFFDLRNQNGLMRNIIIRTSSTGEVMLIVVFYEDDQAKREALLSHIAQKFSEITSLIYIINRKANDTITDQEIHVFKGNESIFEEMEGLKFKIGPKSFYQTNSEQAYNLYKIARDFAGLTGKELVYDLYTGTGTIANFIASRAKQVIGIEYVPEAIEDAKVNSEINNITNTLFFAGDMKDILNTAFIEQYGRPDVIITDPPRAGMHDDVIETILFAEPQRIVYVSCNPATQARDLNLLSGKYKVSKVQPVDMFPHTHHVENVVLLTS